MKPPREKSTVLALATVIAAAIFSLAESGGAARGPAPPDSRDPFVLEIPELGQSITAPEARIPTADLRTIKFLIRKPFADSINLGQIFVTINGEAGGLALGVNPGLQGHVATCNLEKIPRLKLRPGKNVIEISAQDRQRNWYYASYVLFAGGRPIDDSSIASGATIDYVTSHPDQEPPEISLIEPRGGVRALAIRLAITVRGFVIDHSGLGVSVKLNGQPAALSRANTPRGLHITKTETTGSTSTGSSTFSFEGQVKLSAGTSLVVIEARDGLGNVTIVKVPVRGRQAVTSGEFKGRKFAVIIGVSRYKFHEGGLEDLGYADADARAVRDFLVRPEGGSFQKDDILYLENEHATLATVRDGLDRFLPRAGPNDLIVVFIAGHGSPDPYAPQNLYFLMHDTRVADMPHSALPMKDVQAALDSNVRAQRVVVFIDACHAAGLSGKKLVTTRGLENNLINLYASKLFKETGRAILTSSGINEVSQEGPDWGGGHGVFTLALLDGLRGEADTNGDHFITAGELFAYVRDRVRTETGFHQNPYALPGINQELTLAVANK